MDKKPVRTGKYCLSNIPRSLSRLTAAAALSVCMLGAGANSYAVDFGRGFVNLGSGFTVPVVDNGGQLPGSIDFVAPGPTGNTVYFYDNGEIGLALRGHNGGANSFTTISHVSANTQAFSSGTPRSSHTHYFSGNGISLPTNLNNYNDVVASNLYDDISARFEVSGRQLIGTYEVQAGSTTAAIRLSLDNVAETDFNSNLGEVEIRLTSGFILKLHEARVSVGGGPISYVPFVLDGDEPVLDLSGLVSETDVVTITVKFTFGAYSHDYDVTEAAGGDGVAVSTAFNTMKNGADNSDADIIITRLNAAGDQVLSTTILAGEGDDVGYGVAVGDAEAGEYANQIYVSGYTKSVQFPVNGQRDGGAEACVVRLNNEASAVNGGTLMSGSGRDVAHHLVLCGGSLAVVGATDGGLADMNRGQMNFTTSFPAVSDADKVQTYYLAVLNADANTVGERASFGGPQLGIPIRVDCINGVFDVGIESGDIVTGSCNTTFTTEMSDWFNAPCNGSNAGIPDWGWHALCWKNLNSLTHVISTGNCNSPTAPPSGAVAAGDEIKLNNLEANSNCFNCTGCPTWFDPFGRWELNYCNKYTWSKDLQIMELALGAAYYQICCGSPVYANWWPQFNTNAAFLIRKVHFQLQDANGSALTSLLQLCGSEYASAKNGDMFDAPCLKNYNGQSNSKIQLCNMEVVPWKNNQSASNYLQIDDMWDLSELNSRWSQAMLYIADPPESEPNMGVNIQEMTHRLAMLTTADASVETASYVDGAVEETQVATRTIRVAAFHAPGQPAAMPTSVDGQKGDGLSVSGAFGTLTSRPNPASGEITVTYEVADAAMVRLEIYDAMGQKVGMVDAGYRQPREYSVSYDTGNLAVGTYYLRLSSESGVLTMPLVIVR